MSAPADPVAAGYRLREMVVRDFFTAEAPRVSRLCHAMAQRFFSGGRLIAFGAGAAVTDAQHVSVEFVHPVIVGKRALPAVALVNDVASTLGLAYRHGADHFARQLEVMGRPDDIALGMLHGPQDAVESVAAGLKQAASSGMLPIWLGTVGGRDDGGAEYRFEVDCEDPFVVQEVHETLYHVLWELVHVFFEHKGLLSNRPQARTHDSGRSSFLYPFLAQSETDFDGVLAEVNGSVLQKAEDVIAMRRASMDPSGLAETARLISQRVHRGGQVLVFGNGGSATDAQDLVADLVAPAEDMRPVPALSLTNDAAVMTAIGNDVGFENVFARQVIAHGTNADVAIAISTSGGSRNVVAALQEAKRRDMLTVGFGGYGGGRLSTVCDRVHVVQGDYIPRIQEAQATQYHLLRSLIR